MYTQYLLFATGILGKKIRINYFLFKNCNLICYIYYMESGIDNPIQRERKAAESVPKIATQANLEYFDLPKKIKGLTILDVGAGLSTITAQLQKQGANAIAVDYAYEDLDKLQAATRYAPGTFRETPTKGKIKAVAAFAGQLPFPDNSINICLSSFFIDQLVVKHGDTMIKIVSEVLRVLKPGGNLQINPWDPDFVREVNVRNLLSFLERNQVPYYKEYAISREELKHLPKGYQLSPMFRLKIVKPGNNESTSKNQSWISRLLRRG